MDSKPMEFAKAIVRPLITVATWFTILGMVIFKHDVPELLWSNGVIFVTWWFSDRSHENAPSPPPKT